MDFRSFPLLFGVFAFGALLASLFWKVNPHLLNLSASASDPVHLRAEDSVALKDHAVSDLAAARESGAFLPEGERVEAAGIMASRAAGIDPVNDITSVKARTDAELAVNLSDVDEVGRMAARSPAGLAALLERLPANNEASAKYVRLAEVWAASDPAKALEWAKGIEFDALRSEALMALYRTWAKDDPKGALAALDGMEDASLRRKIFGDIATEVISLNPGAADRWARGLPGDDRAHALGLLGGHLATSDPNVAALYLKEAMDSGYERLAGPSEEIGYAHALRDPASAGRWAMGLPEGDIQQHAAEGVVRAWVKTDPVAASEWIATLPPGESRNGATYYLVEGILGSDPASAFQWAGNIEGDAEKRLYLLQRSVDYWTKSSPDRAKAAIEELSLPVSERQSLLSCLRW